MTDLGSLILLILFAVSIIGTYLAVRRSLVKTAVASVGGGIVNIVLLTAYILSQGGTLPIAITIGLALGLLFTLMSISIGAYFLAHAKDVPAD